jgi:rod shape-determining protein MreC
MGNIFYFFGRFGAFILFLILESISLYMVAQYNTKQKEIYQSSANYFTGSLYEKVNNVTKFFYLKNIADSLAAENARLRQELDVSKYLIVNETGKVSFPLDTSVIRDDTIAKQSKVILQHFTYVAAEVINNKINSPENYLTINKGRLYGITKGMGVISSKGVIGIVTNVTDHFSQVMSVLNRDFSLSGMIKRNRYYGSLKWAGNDPRYMVLDEVPKYTEAIQGDTIITSGYSDIFPGSLNLGIVEKVNVDGGSNFYNLKVRLNENVINVKYVYVVKNLLLDELHQLNSEVQ